MRSETVGAQPLRPWAWAERTTAMRRLTWALLTGAFVAWLVLAGGFAGWASRLVETAAAPAPTVLEQVSGIVLYREVERQTDTSAQQGMKVFDGDEVITSPGASASLRVFDGSLVQLYPEARLRTDAVRIGWLSPAATRAELVLVDGALRLSIPLLARKAHTLNVATPHTAAAFLPGEYTVRVGGDGTRISVWGGRIAAVVGDQIVEIRAGEKVIVGAGGAPYRVVEILEDVVANGGFVRRFEGWDPWEERERGRPDVPGSLEIIAPGEEGAPSRALRISRTSQIDAHNETGVRQTLAREVSGARQILVRGRVKVDFASLSGGGYLGSEYPLMLRVRYVDSRGAEQVWAQGIYYANPENRPAQLGRLVERGVWTDFSADLTEGLAHATRLEHIEVSGAGHTFDASVSDIRLLVD